MSNKQSAKASSFLSDLLDDGDELKDAISQANEPTEPEVSYIVYFIGDKPDTVWEYFHKPDGGKILDINGNETGEYQSYGRLYGFWEENPDNKGSRQFKEHKSNNLKLMDWDTFMDRVPPNKDCTKVYESEADFLLELI